VPVYQARWQTSQAARSPYLRTMSNLLMSGRTADHVVVSRRSSKMLMLSSDIGLMAFIDKNQRLLAIYTSVDKQNVVLREGQSPGGYFQRS
jgi:hypothetical protein